MEELQSERYDVELWEAFQRPSSEPLYCCPRGERRGRNAGLLVLVVFLYLED